jgi:hypothetical protein
MALSIRCTTTSRSEVHHSTISPHGVVRYEPTIVPDHITRNLEGHGTNLSQALSSVCWESVCDRACVPCRCTAPVYPSSGVVSRRCNCFAICNSSNSSAQGEGTERSSVPEHRKGWMENHSTPRSVPTSPDVTSPVTCNFTSQVQRGLAATVW